MAKKIEDYIKQQRAALQNHEPASGHQNRFMERLEQAPAPKNNPRWIWGVAASLVLLLGLGTTFWLTGPGLEGNDSLALNDTIEELVAMAPEVMEAETYYQEQIDSKLIEVESSRDNESAIFQHHLASLKTLEKEYEVLKAELLLHYGDKRVVNSMIENYRLRLEILEQLSLQLEKTKELKLSDHAKTKV